MDVEQQGQRAPLDQPEVIIDLRDHVVAAGGGELIIDLRDQPPAPPGDGQTTCSGRPLSLQDGHHLLTITDGDLWNQAENFVYDTYVAIGYTHPTSKRQVEELARWADRSRFHAVVDDDGGIVGTVRNIFGVYDELPVGQFERTAEVEPDPVCELSSLVVDPRQRSTGVIEHLYRAGWMDAWRAGSNAVVALIDDWLFDVFQRTYHLPFRKVGEAKHYMGTDPVPVAMPLDGPSYRAMARTNPDFWAWTLEALQAHEIVGWELPIVIRDVEDLVRYGLGDTPLASSAATSA